MKTIVFACVHSAGRSQMAAAFFNKLVDPTKAFALAAGTNPATHVHPIVVATMKELGHDLSHARPTLLTEELAHKASLLITMGCKEYCPYIPGLEIRTWNFADPKDKDLDQVRLIRNEIHKKVQALVKEL